jgi:hypothetical protein
MIIVVDFHRRRTAGAAKKEIKLLHAPTAADVEDFGWYGRRSDKSRSSGFRGHRRRVPMLHCHKNLRKLAANGNAPCSGGFQKRAFCRTG